MNDIHIALKVFGAYSLFLTIFGTISNTLSIFICLRKKLRKNPMFIFFSFMLIFDTIALFEYNLSTGFYKPFNDGIILEHLSEAWCKLSAFLQVFALHASVWFLLVFLFIFFFKFTPLISFIFKGQQCP